MPIDEELYRLAFSWLSLAWQWVHSGQREQAALYLGVSHECANALKRISIDNLPDLARSGAITFTPRVPSRFWRFITATGDPDVISIYSLLAADIPEKPRGAEND